MKSITIRYFDVDYKGLTSNSSLVERLVNKLSSTAAERLMPINKQESDKADLISDFSSVSKGRMITGTCLRIVNSKDVPIITEDMLKQNQFKVSSININAKEKEKTCLDYFYFCLSDTRLIVTLEQRSSISRFEIYLNWLLKTTESDEVISFTPIVDEEKVSLSDLKRITINNTSEMILSSEEEKEESVKSKMYNITEEVLKKLFSDTDSLKELMESRICSANLVIKFSKPRGMGEDEYKKKTAGTILKPLENPDHITFQAKGKKIKGSQVLKVETIEVDCDENTGAVSEQDVYQQLIRRMNS